MIRRDREGENLRLVDDAAAQAERRRRSFGDQADDLRAP
jgi:hypothetical protein